MNLINTWRTPNDTLEPVHNGLEGIPSNAYACEPVTLKRV